MYFFPFFPFPLVQSVAKFFVIRFRWTRHNFDSGKAKKKVSIFFFLVFFFFSSSSFSFFRLQRVTSGAPIYIGDRLKTLYAIASAGPDPYFMELGLGICRSINGRRLSPAAEKKIANKKKKNEQQKESHRSTS